MPRNNYFEFQPTKDLNRLIREYGVACLSDTLPPAPTDMVNVNWQTDTKGNISAFIAPGSGGGGVNPGEQLQLPFYQATGAVVSPTSITTDSTGRNLTVPALASIGTLNSTGGITYPSTSVAPFPSDYVQSTNDTTIQGAGFSLGNVGGWSTGVAANTNLNSSQRGIHHAHSYMVNKQGVGDTAGIYGYVFTDGGVSAQSDEGVVGTQSEVAENLNYYHGTVASTTGTGDRAPVWSIYTNGNSWTSDGSFMLDISKGTVAGKMSSASVPLTLTTATGKVQTTYLNYLPTTATTVGGSSAPLPVTTAVGVSNLTYDPTVTYNAGQFVADITSNPFQYVGYQSLINGNLDNAPASSPSAWSQVQVVPNQNTTADSPMPVTFVVNLCTIGGVTDTFSVGDHVWVAGNWYPEQSIITAETNHGDGTQTVTLALRNPNDMVILFKGGVAGQYISFDENQSFSAIYNIPNRTSYYAFGSLTGIDLIYGFNVGGSVQNHTLPQSGSEAAQADGGSSSGFHLYPGAEVVLNSIYQPPFNTAGGPIGTLEQNNVAWEAGDVVENPHYPVFGGNAAWFTKVQYTPSNSGQGSVGLFLTVGGIGFAGPNTWTAQFLNNSPVSYFQSNGGPLTAPIALGLNGPKSHGVFMDMAPENGGSCLIVTGPNSPDQSLVQVLDLNWLEGGQLNFNIPSNTWQLLNLVADGVVHASVVNVDNAITANSTITGLGLISLSDISSITGTFSGDLSFVDGTARNLTLSGTLDVPSANIPSIFAATQVSSPSYIGTTVNVTGAVESGSVSTGDVTSSGIVSSSSLSTGSISTSGITSSGSVSASAFTGTSATLAGALDAASVSAPIGAFSTSLSTGSFTSSSIVNSGQTNSASYAVGGVAGASGTFTTVDSKTVTVSNGIITSIA